MIGTCHKELRKINYQRLRDAPRITWFDVVMDENLDACGTEMERGRSGSRDVAGLLSTIDLWMTQMIITT